MKVLSAIAFATACAAITPMPVACPYATKTIETTEVVNMVPEPLMVGAPELIGCTEAERQIDEFMARH